MFLGQLTSTLPTGVDASIVLESVDVLKSRHDWPEIVHAMSLAIEVRTPAFREIPFGLTCVHDGVTGHMGCLLPLPWRGLPGRCLFASDSQSSEC